jgi:hypothetical protein
MAVVVIQEFEATTEQYDQVNEKLGDTQSAEDFQKFVQEKLIPAIAEVDPDAPQAPEPEIYDVHDLQKA